MIVKEQSSFWEAAIHRAVILAVRWYPVLTNVNLVFVKFRDQEYGDRTAD
jgi:hypothetical protein